MQSGKQGKISKKNQEKEEKSGRKSKNREGSFTLPLLTGLATLLGIPLQTETTAVAQECICDAETYEWILVPPPPGWFQVMAPILPHFDD